MAKTLEQIISDIDEEKGYNEDAIYNWTDDEVRAIARYYALEAIKADRERVAENAKIRIVILGQENTVQIADKCYFKDIGAEVTIDKQSILNLPIELS